jgi:hypothetical protein
MRAAGLSERFFRDTIPTGRGFTSKLHRQDFELSPLVVAEAKLDSGNRRPVAGKRSRASIDWR